MDSYAKQFAARGQQALKEKLGDKYNEYMRKISKKGVVTRQKRKNEAKK